MPAIRADGGPGLSWGQYMDTPKFTIEWESRWHGFRTSIPVLLARLTPGTPRDYVRTGIRLRGPAVAFIFESACALAFLSATPMLLTPDHEPQVVSNSPLSDYTVYYVRQDIPNVSDLNGAGKGRAGIAGGTRAFIPQQVIRIARGTATVAAVVDASALHLPVTREKTSNLLAVLRGAATPVVLPAAPDVRKLSSRLPAPQKIEAVAAAARVENLHDNSTARPLPIAVIQPPPEINVVAHGPQLPHAATIIPPPPDVTAVNGSPKEIAAVTAVAPTPAPPGMTGGTAARDAISLSSDTGNAVAVPEGGQPGVTAMSPSGSAIAGAGGRGGTKGTGIGLGTGNGIAGDGVGIAEHGEGYGADARGGGGISTASGPGGAGLSGAPHAAAGVAISGGVVNIPSFSSSTAPAQPTYSGGEKSAPPAIVIVATSRSGGGLAQYGVLRGNRVYTTYLSTPKGDVVLQYADPSGGANDLDLTPPQLINADTAQSGAIMRTIISCVLEPTGDLRNIRVLDSATPQVAAALIKYLGKWRFRPALRGDKAVAVQAILGFGITTQ